MGMCFQIVVPSSLFSGLLSRAAGCIFHEITTELSASVRAIRSFSSLYAVESTLYWRPSTINMILLRSELNLQPSSDSAPDGTSKVGTASDLLFASIPGCIWRRWRMNRSVRREWYQVKARSNVGIWKRSSKASSSFLHCWGWLKNGWDTS